MSRVDLIYDPFGDSRPISNVSSGTLAGLVNFRSQILSPAMDGLDNLARVLTKEVNQIHTSGIDAKTKEVVSCLKLSRFLTLPHLPSQAWLSSIST